MSFNQIKVELCSWWGGDRDAANAAWASSTDKAKLEAKTDHDVKRLVTDLVTLGHDTPKERIWLEFFITCPLYVEREIDKYRLTVQYQDFRVECNVGAFGREGITQNELSARYRTLPERAYSLPNDVLSILEKVDPGSRTTADHNWNLMLQEQYEAYSDALAALKSTEKTNVITNAEYKRVREVLRGILGTAYLTDMRLVCNMNSLEHLLNQRLPRVAQEETRYTAYLMLKEVQDKGVCPVMLEQMIQTHGWTEFIKELSTYA